MLYSFSEQLPRRRSNCAKIDSPVYKAIAQNDKAGLTQLINEDNTLVNKPFGPLQQYPIHAVVRMGHIDLLDLLIIHQVNLMVWDNRKSSPMHFLLEIKKMADLEDATIIIFFDKLIQYAIEQNIIPKLMRLKDNRKRTLLDLASLRNIPYYKDKLTALMTQFNIELSALDVLDEDATDNKVTQHLSVSLPSFKQNKITKRHSDYCRPHH